MKMFLKKEKVCLHQSSSLFFKWLFHWVYYWYLLIMLFFVLLHHSKLDIVWLKSAVVVRISPLCKKKQKKNSFFSWSYCNFVSLLTRALLTLHSSTLSLHQMGHCLKKRKKMQTLHLEDVISKPIELTDHTKLWYVAQMWWWFECFSENPQFRHICFLFSSFAPFFSLCFSR